MTGCNDRVHISTVQRVGRGKKPSYFFQTCNGSAADRSKKSKNKKPEIKIPGLIRFQNQLGLIKKERRGFKNTFLWNSTQNIFKPLHPPGRGFYIYFK